MDTIATARELAAAHPHAKLPCPVCAASLNAENLERHLAKVHAGASSPATSEWRGKGLLGVFPCTLALDGDAVVLRHYLGFARRVVALPCAVEVGGLVGMRSAPSLGGSDYHTPGVEIRVGRYLRLTGDKTITIGCRQSTQFTSHWNRNAWREGGKRSSCDIRVPLSAMLAVEYSLARRGLLSPVAS